MLGFSPKTQFSWIRRIVWKLISGWAGYRLAVSLGLVQPTSEVCFPGIFVENPSSFWKFCSTWSDVGCAPAPCCLTQVSTWSSAQGPGESGISRQALLERSYEQVQGPGWLRGTCLFLPSPSKTVSVFAHQPLCSASEREHALSLECCSRLIRIPELLDWCL